MIHTFGCEFEFSSSWDEVKEHASKAIAKYYGPNSLKAAKDWFRSRNNYKKWHLKLDSSTGCELCTPISTQKDIKRIINVIRYLQDRVKITKNDSLHVHVHAGDIKPELIVSSWLAIEKTIVRCFPKHRRQKYKHSSYYCAQLIENSSNKNIVAKVFQQALEFSDDHHSVLSTHHYKSNKTVEFRIAEGTTDPDMIRNWVKFCLDFIRFSADIDPFKILCSMSEKMCVDWMADFLKIKDQDLRRWLNYRYDKFTH